jgi:hypothetical protein
MRPSWHARLVLLRPRRVVARLDQLVAAGVIPRAPNLWQIQLGVLRMWHRMVFRSDTVGTCSEHPVRSTWRARLLQWRLFRGPCLIAERAIAPFDHSGLTQPSWRMVRHLLGAHHDASEFAYDLEILKADPLALEEVRARAAEVVAGRSSRARWLADLCVYERYHEALLAATERALAGEPLLGPAERDDPDIGFPAYIRWCLAQPETPRATWIAWRAGDFPRRIDSTSGSVSPPPSRETSSDAA